MIRFRTFVEAADQAKQQKVAALWQQFKANGGQVDDEVMKWSIENGYPPQQSSEPAASGAIKTNSLEDLQKKAATQSTNPTGTGELTASQQAAMHGRMDRLRGKGPVQKEEPIKWERQMDGYYEVKKPTDHPDLDIHNKSTKSQMNPAPDGSYYYQEKGTNRWRIHRPHVGDLSV